MSTNRQLFTAMSAFVLKSSHLGLQHPILYSFWAAIATEAVAAMFDQGRSARCEAQKQNQEDIVLLLLPILNDGLCVDNVPDLRVGCYMNQVAHKTIMITRLNCSLQCSSTRSLRQY